MFVLDKVLKNGFTKVKSSYNFGSNIHYTWLFKPFLQTINVIMD